MHHSDSIIVPGVGAFPEAMKRFDQLGFTDRLIRAAELGNPILGICLGMQILFSQGEEHKECKGLNLIPGRVIRLPIQSTAGEQLRIPSVGWSRITCADKSINNSLNKILNIVNDHSFYFVHSYHAVPSCSVDVAATYERGADPIVAIVNRNNIWGVQFHPEKSGKAGLIFLENFLNL
jgi:glutamine amidotransferase